MLCSLQPKKKVRETSNRKTFPLPAPPNHQRPLLLQPKTQGRGFGFTQYIPLSCALRTAPTPVLAGRGIKDAKRGGEGGILEEKEEENRFPPGIAAINLRPAKQR